MQALLAPLTELADYQEIIKDRKKFRFHPLYEDRLCAVVYEDHPLADRKEIQLKELEGEDAVGIRRDR